MGLQAIRDITIRNVHTTCQVLFTDIKLILEICVVCG